MSANFASDLDHLVTQVREEGFCLIPNVIPAAECDAMCENLTAVADRWRRADQLQKLKTSFVPGLINFDQSFAS